MLELILGILVGVVLTRLFFRPKYAGVLIAYETEPDEQTDLYLELEDSPDMVARCEYVTFKVKNIRK